MTTGKPNILGNEETVPLKLARSTVEDESTRLSSFAESVKLEDRLGFARAATFSAVSVYWRVLRKRSAWRWSLTELPDDIVLPSISKTAKSSAVNIGRAVSNFDAMKASYGVGVLYTSLMHKKIRARGGAFYTPPSLCEALLDMATEAGTDWSSARVLDPACGGGAFLLPLAQRMVESQRDRNSANTVIDNIQRQLRGFELDPFAAWLSQVFLEVSLGELCHEAGRRLSPVVRVCDSLEQAPGRARYDLVVGNPPYGRFRLSQALRKKFQRSLFGHSNLYGVFTDLALRFTRTGGVIAYVTPTSFLSGEYFKALRGLLGSEATPVSIDFVARRKGVFNDVLQETLLATYKRGEISREGKVHFISSRQDGSIFRTAAGTFKLPDDPRRPWLIPRTEAQSALLRQVGELPYRLVDYGYTVSTGPLVWNRHKLSLRDRPGKGRYPLIWAESVRSDGEFSFRAKRRNHKPYFEPSKGEKWVGTEFPCLLLQRTTAKEQCRRLIAAELPASFIAEHGAVVIENHLNMIKPLNGAPRVAPAVLSALLNSNVVDQVFRCINGSVAVSAYELEALPLPLPEETGRIAQLLHERASRATVEHAINRLYGRQKG